MYLITVSFFAPRPYETSLTTYLTSFVSTFFCREDQDPQIFKVLNNDPENIIITLIVSSQDTSGYELISREIPKSIEELGADGHEVCCNINLMKKI